MSTYKNYGFWGSIEHWYTTWQGRFSAQFFTNVFVKCFENFNTLFPFTLFLIVIFIYSLTKIIILIRDRINVSFSLFNCTNIALFLFNIFIISNFEFSTFYWVSASSVYFIGLGFALLGITQLFTQSQNVFTYFLLILSFLIAGGSAEHFGAICVLLLGLYWLFLIYNQRFNLKNAFSDRSTLKVSIALATCTLAFLIMVIAPGNQIRRSYMPSTSVVDAFIIGIKSVFDLTTKYIPGKTNYLLILSFPFIFVGTLVRKKDKADDYQTTFIIFWTLPLLILFLYLCVVPSAYALAGLGPLRGLTHIAFYIAIYVAFVSFIIGFKTLFSRKLALLLSFFSVACFLIITRDRIRVNLPDTIHFAKSEKARYLYLQSLKQSGNKNTIYVDSIYSSPNNLLWYNEIGKDSTDIQNYWINTCISDGMKLEFDIKLKK